MLGQIHITRLMGLGKGGKLLVGRVRRGKLPAGRSEKATLLTEDIVAGYRKEGC